MINDLRLQNYRSYKDDTFEFGPGVNIIVGPNASGKTNLLEAVLVSCRGSSYRVKDADVVMFDEPWARIEGDTDEGKRVVTVERTETTTVKKFVINGVNQKRLSLQKSIPVIVFEPDHLRLLTGGPERRRNYLDELLEQTISGFATLRREYRRTLAQRNRLLKTNPRPDELFVWNVRLSELGGKLVQHRLRLVAELAAEIEELYQALSQSKTSIRLEYLSSCAVDSYSTSLLKKLESSLEQDRLRGFTTHGPHRDDLVVIIDGQKASVSASRGESRTILLTLKILELKILERSRDKKPILLLDDVFSELDGKRRKALTSYLKDHQTFITTTDADIVVQHFMDDCTIIPVANK